MLSFNVGFPESRKNGIRIDLTSRAFNFLFLLVISKLSLF